MGKRASQAMFGAMPGTPVNVSCGYRLSGFSVGVS